MSYISTMQKSGYDCRGYIEMLEAVYGNKKMNNNVCKSIPKERELSEG